MRLKDTRNKFVMTLRKVSNQIDSVAFFTFTFKPIGHDQIDAIRLATALIVDPGKFFTQLVG